MQVRIQKAQQNDAYLKAKAEILDDKPYAD